MTFHAPRLAGAVLTTLLAVALAACGGSTPSASTAPATEEAPAPASVAPPGSSDASPSAAAAATPGASLATTGRIEVADKGFALTLPDGWTRVDVTPEALEAAMAASEIDPAL